VLGVRVDVEVRLAQKADERHAAVLGQRDREARRCRHGGHDRDARKKGFLHDFVRRASADKQPDKPQDE